MSVQSRARVLLGVTLTVVGSTLWIGRDHTPDQTDEVVPLTERDAGLAGRPTDLLGYRENVRLLHQQRLEAEKLETEDAAVLNWALTKQQVAVAVAEGRLGLLEAATWFRDLDARAPNVAQKRASCFPGASEDERYCRQVVDHVQNLLESLHQDSTPTVDCLKAELEGRLKDGSLRLPPRSPANEGQLP
jgi:hypothetical protein